MLGEMRPDLSSKRARWLRGQKLSYLQQISVRKMEVENFIRKQCGVV
jgi:hypothetical protein